MDLRRKDFEGIQALAAIWKTTPGAELEAGMQRLDLIGWQDIIQGLRALGMREAPQIVKLNITLANDIRFTLEGAGVIQAYCEDNRLAGKPFVAMVKENVAGAVPVNIDNYGVRAKLKRETPLDPEDARIKDALSRWDSLVKYYRMIQRFEFVAPGGLGMRFDISVVRSGGSKSSRTFQEARVTSAPSTYEAEVEITGTRDSMTGVAAASLLVRGLSWMLQGQQRSFVLVSTSGARSVLDGIQAIFKGGRGFKYPGPQPATLERGNLEEIAEPGVPNLRSVSYNVTDKADGLRCLLYVAENGRVFLIDGGGRVYATGKETAKSAAGLVLDGEWIRRDRKGATVSHFYAFDILALNGSTAVAARPFLDTKEKETRHAAMVGAVTSLGSATQAVKTPGPQTLQVGVKTFRTAANVFRDAAAVVLDDAASAPYNTDGLIFTPNAAPLPLGRGTWAAQLKWKPASHNTIDFLVVVDKERGADGLPSATGPDQIGTKYRDDAGTTVRYKTLRLFVGSRRDAAFADPRATVTGGEALPISLEEGDYRAVEFRPSEPRDPMAAICYVAIGEGGSDPAGAAPAATRLDADRDEIRCESGDAIQSNMIVEMSYRPERGQGWRWVPMRIRHDKTERLQKGAVGGTMNADWVANSIWSSIHNPVTEEMVKTGEITETCAPTGMVSTYYTRKAPQRDLAKSQCMRNFHNDYVKRDVLLRRTIKPGNSLCDLAMGKAGDLHKWVSSGVGYVFGCDYAANNINDPQDGAYSRLLSKMIEMGGRDKVVPMVFVQADASVPLKSDAAGITADDKALIQREMPRIDAGFDVVSCMFAIHYMFRDQATLHGFLTNLADLVKVGGYFVGCGFDGDAVTRLLAKEDSITGRDGGTDIWAITKRYAGSSLPATKEGLGYAIDVDFISIGDTYTEYLVSWPFLKEQLASIGLELLTAEDQAAMGLSASTQMFADALESSKGTRRYDMPDVLRRYSFLNRWYIFRRIEDKRPEPLPFAMTPVKALLSPIAEVGESKEATEAVADSQGSPKIDVIELPEEKPLLITGSAERDERLGPTLDDWPRYLTLGTLVPGGLVGSDSHRYPSIEAAIASAKYQIATDKPALGPQLFSVEGALHQKFEKIRAAGANSKSVEDQVMQTRIASGKAKMKALKATWNQDLWEAKKEEVYRAYLRARYLTDGRFAEMINRAAEIGAPLMLVNGTEYNELGVGVKEDGSLALDPDGAPTGGKNLVGKWMMETTI